MIIDTHCHIDDERYIDDFEDIVDTWSLSEYSGIDIESIKIIKL